MKNLRTLVASCAVAALVITAVAIPVSAAPSKGHLTIVNGKPGIKVDVCIGTKKELRSRLGYGGVARKRLAGTKALRFRKASPGVCKGKRLGGKNVNLSGGADKTVVLTSKAPKVLVFDNSGIGAQQVAASDSAGSIRHAADLAANLVYMRRTIWNDPIIKDDPIEPTLVAPFDKGDEGRFYLTVALDYVMRVKATRADPGTVIAKAPLVELETLVRYEYILIGTKAANARLLLIQTALASLGE